MVKRVGFESTIPLTVYKLSKFAPRTRGKIKIKIYPLLATVWYLVLKNKSASHLAIFEDQKLTFGAEIKYYKLF